jgi:hypothetical protein
MTVEHILNQLDYQILLSPDSNDHEVRLIVDGVDILGDTQLGLDPLDFIRQVHSDASGNVVVGRCVCGCIGCDDVIAKVRFDELYVQWDLLGNAYRFESNAYRTTLKEIAVDHSWEDIGRRVERLVTAYVKADQRWRDGQSNFDWVSTRCSSHQLTYSFTRNGAQIIFSTGWDGRTEQDALTAHNRLFHEKFGSKH